MKVCLQLNVSTKFLVHSSAGLWHFTKTQCKLQFIDGWSMVLRSLSDTAFSDAKKLLVGCREQLGKKDTEFDSKVSHSFELQTKVKKHYVSF